MPGDVVLCGGCFVGGMYVIGPHRHSCTHPSCHADVITGRHVNSGADPHAHTDLYSHAHADRHPCTYPGCHPYTYPGRYAHADRPANAYTKRLGQGRTGYSLQRDGRPKLGGQHKLAKR